MECVGNIHTMLRLNRFIPPSLSLSSLQISVSVCLSICPSVFVSISIFISIYQSLYIYLSWCHQRTKMLAYATRCHLIKRHMCIVESHIMSSNELVRKGGQRTVEKGERVAKTAHAIGYAENKALICRRGRLCEALFSPSFSMCSVADLSLFCSRWSFYIPCHCLFSVCH